LLYSLQALLELLHQRYLLLVCPLRFALIGQVQRFSQSEVYELSLTQRFLSALGYLNYNCRSKRLKKRFATCSSLASLSLGKRRQEICGVLSLLALLVQKYKYCALCNLLVACLAFNDKAQRFASRARARRKRRQEICGVLRTQFTGFTRTKVQILREYPRSPTCVEGHRPLRERVCGDIYRKHVVLALESNNREQARILCPPQPPPAAHSVSVFAILYQYSK
jgi:hypothetical protein